MSFTEELATIRQQGEQSLPSGVYNTFQTNIQDLSRSGILNRSLKVGDRAPDFILPNTSEQDIRLYEVLENGPVVISFFRGIWCVFCAAELHAYQTVADIESLKALTTDAYRRTGIGVGDAALDNKERAEQGVVLLYSFRPGVATPHQSPVFL